MSKKHKHISKTVPQPQIGEDIKNYLPDKIYLIALAIITIIGCFLRFYNLGYNSIWLDEASTVTFITAGSFVDIWNFIATIEPTPPLFLWLEYIMLVFGNNEFILRFIPALFSTLTIPVMYFVGKEFLDRNVGIISATAFAISPFLILYAQEARAYSVLLFFISLMMLCYFKAMNRNEFRYWILFGITGSLAFWTHYYSSIIIAAIIIFTLVMYKLKYLKELITSSAIIGITAIPLAVVSLPMLLERQSIGASSWGLQGINVILDTLIQFTGFNIILSFIILSLFICGIIILYLNNEGLERGKSLFLLWILGFTFTVSIYLSSKMPIVPRYLIFLNIFIILGVAVSYRFFYKITNNKNTIFVVIFLLMLTSAPFLMNYYSGYSKDDWRGFSQTLSQITQKGDSIVIVPGYISQPLNYYYSNKTDETIEYLVYNETQLISARERQTGNTYYIVTSDIQSANPNGDALRWINANTKQINQNNNIYLFKS